MDPSERSYPSINSSETQPDLNKLLSQLNLGFAQIHTKAVKNDKHFEQLESLTKES